MKWNHIKEQKDIELINNGKDLVIVLGEDAFGTNCVQVPVDIIKNAIATQQSDFAKCEICGRDLNHCRFCNAVKE